MDYTFFGEKYQHDLKDKLQIYIQKEKAYTQENFRVC